MQKNYFDDESYEIRYKKLYQTLEMKIKVLAQSFLWEGSRVELQFADWLSNFQGKNRTQEIEIINAMFLLSQFMYFGENTIRDFLKAIYRDLLIKPMVASIRKSHNCTLNLSLVQEDLNRELALIKF
ncbi:hypothetical protein KKE54_04470, partial [bacterium]|nr:hypothetical protein [bacterium]